MSPARESRETRSAHLRHNPDRGCRGFSLVEVVTVGAIMIILLAVAVPFILSMEHASRLRGAGSDFSGILQGGRIRAVQDDKFYSVYILGNQAYVDITANGGTSVLAQDPSIYINPEVTSVAAGSAPATTNLYGQFLPSGSTLTVKDGSTGNPITFGPRGLPCTKQTAPGGTICDSSGGATAFWAFFQDSSTSAWEAVTVSPAGRIRKWYYGGTGWNAI